MMSMTIERTTTVEALCIAAGLGHAMLNSPDRVVHLTHGGGHNKIRRTNTRRHDLFVDLGLLRGSTNEERIKDALIVLAAELGCYEAGESLGMEGIVVQTRSGRYVRAERSVGNDALIGPLAPKELRYFHTELR